ncbi:hypothetical protein [Paenibacillus ferrarius]|uniref:hypothetical protein n=1 Tax=Paenibacillus ferrarius TaxID=1469647 RepID=UPI003D2BAFF7
MYTKKELIKELGYSGKEKDVFMPNEIFEDIRSNQRISKSSSHVAFAYSYVYLICWLYRYCKYGENDNLQKVSAIKKILTYSETNKTLDYIIKQDGELDMMRYTKTDKDFPQSWHLDDYGTLLFEMFYESIDEDIKSYLKINPRNIKIKTPLKAFHRNDESIEERLLDGTFYDISNTHNVSFDVFLFCMSHKELGCTGFYLYSFFKFKCDMFKTGVDISLEAITEQTGIKADLRDRTLASLKKYNMIKSKPTNFVPGIPHYERRASKYKINEFEYFSGGSTTYEVRKVIPLDEWEKEQKENEKLKKILPF